MSARSLPDDVRDAFAALRSTAEAGRLAHGYIISSSRLHAGTMLADLILQWLYCQAPERPCGICRRCVQVTDRHHADVIFVEPESKSRAINIDQIREVNHFARQTSYGGGWKGVVILGADRMNESAANAFLKTLEEPPAQCLLLLVTDTPQALMATIWSRCQHLPVGRGHDASQNEVETALLEWLRNRSPAHTALEQGALMNGILLKVRAEAEAEEEHRAGEDVTKDLLEARVQARAIGARIDLLRTLYRWERDVMACLVGADDESLHFPSDRAALQRQAAASDLAACFARLQEVDRARRLLDGNLPENAVWEAILPRPA